MSTVKTARPGGYKWCEIGLQDTANDDPAETSSFTNDAHAIGEITSVSHTLGNAPQEVRSGRRIEKVDVYHGKLEPSVDMEYFMATGRELYYVMGTQDTVTEPTTGIFVHPLLLSNTIPYFSAEAYGEEAKSDRFLGCLVESWKMSASEGSIVNCSLTAQALNWDGAQTKPTYGTGEVIPVYANIGELYHFEHATFTIDDSTVETDYNDLCHSFELNVSHTYERAPAFGKQYGAYGTISERDTKLAITVDVENGSYLFQELWSSQVTFTTTFSLAKTFAIGTYNHQIDLTFGECKVLNFPKAYDATIRVPLDIEVLSGWTSEITDDAADYTTITP